MLVGTAIAAAIGAIAIFNPPHAEVFQAAIAPSSPQLGDTISVTLQMEQPTGAVNQVPVAIVNRQQYPAFMVGQNRWRSRSIE
jgi:hypothetical protein